MEAQHDVSTEDSQSASKIGLKYMLLIIGLYILDQVTKLYIVFNFKSNEYNVDLATGKLTLIQDKVSVIDGYFNIVRVHNSGMAFGIGNREPWSVYVFLAVPIAAIVVLLVLLKKKFFNTKWLKLGWALLFAGVCGNLTDRLIQGFILSTKIPGDMTFMDCLRAGYVVDFLEVKIPIADYVWPAFNVADSCICIAAVIFILSSFFYKPADGATTKA